MNTHIKFQAMSIKLTRHLIYKITTLYLNLCNAFLVFQIAFMLSKHNKSKNIEAKNNLCSSMGYIYTYSVLNKAEFKL
jgi:cbb3-type cytochrome oxidase subunit 3